MKLLSWNVNGLRAVHRKGLFLPWIEHEDTDIVCLQETKAHEEQLPEEILSIDGYYAYFAAPDYRKGYSGVALYTKKKPKSVKPGFGIETYDREGRTLVADYGNFILINCYFPNGGMGPQRLRFKLDFYDEFLSYLDKLMAKKKKIIVCGDVNTAHREIDLTHPKANEMNTGFLPEERAWIDKLISHGFVDTFRMFTKDGGHYTWWDMKTRSRDRNVGWRLDYFYVSKNLTKKVSAATIRPEVMGSDHCPIGLTLAIS
jgi:exodeoxyribonuclease-3